MAKQPQTAVHTLANALTLGLGVGGVTLGVSAVAFPTKIDKWLGFGLTQSAWGSFSLRAVGMRDLAFGAGLLTARLSGQNTGLWQGIFGVSLAVDAYSCMVEGGKPGANGWMKLTAWGLPPVAALTIAGSLVNGRRKPGG